jgi:hypothetical protein
MGMLFTSSLIAYDLRRLGLYLILAVTFWYYPGSGMLAKLFVLFSKF